MLLREVSLGRLVLGGVLGLLGFRSELFKVDGDVGDNPVQSLVLFHLLSLGWIGEVVPVDHADEVGEPIDSLEILRCRRNRWGGLFGRALRLLDCRGNLRGTELLPGDLRVIVDAAREFLRFFQR